jgi:NAD(P)H dehydrogenase (quinone)
MVGDEMRVVAVHASTAPAGHDHAAFTTAVTSARAAGHTVAEIDLRAERFAAVMSPAERAAYHGDSPLITDETRRHAALVEQAEVFVFVYPTTLTTVPASLKGWLERVFVPGVAFVLDERTNRVRRNLTAVRRIVGIATYDGARMDVVRHGDNGRRVLLRALRLNTGLRTRTSWIELHQASRLADEDPAVARFNQRIETRMHRL